MDLILSIFKKKYFIVFILIAFLSNCSHLSEQKKDVAIDVRVSATEFQMGPSLKSAMFEDQTEKYGLLNIEAVHLYAVDVNRDGHTDLVVLDDYYAAPKFYEFNVKEKKFKLIENPFPGIVRANFLNFADFDHDGVYDVVVGSLNQKTEMTQYPSRIYKGEIRDGRLSYKEMGEIDKRLLPTASISILDYNLDGKLDLFLSNWFSIKDNNPYPVPDVLLKGNGFSFVDESNKLVSEYEINRGTKTFRNASPTYGASICDLDRNGIPDILTVSSNGYFNKLWMSLDGEKYKDYGVDSLYAADEDGGAESKGGGNGFFSKCVDYNNDGIVDVVIGNLSRENDPESKDRSAFLTGATFSFPPKFIRTEIVHENQKKNWVEADHRGVFLDYNIDGRKDLIIDNSGFPIETRLVFYEQEKDHSFADRSKEFGVDLVNPSGTITLDVNNDGMMDFIAGQSKVRAGASKTRIYLFVNKFKRGKEGSVRLHLQGKKSNSFGVSSSLKFTTNKNKYFDFVEYNYGSLPSQNEEGIYFGFGDEIPRELEIDWSFNHADRIGRITPTIKKYNLKGLNLKNTHHELNICEDGRILKNKNCY